MAVRKISLFSIILFPFLAVQSILAQGECTSIIVTKGASRDGSVFVTYACDGEFHPILGLMEAGDHEKGDVVVLGKRQGKETTIPQVPHTYKVVSLMNEYQVAIGETTFGGRQELQNPQGLLHYWWLMKLALQRAKTAREAVEVITGLADRYGYASTGESISIIDKNEAWLLEIIGPGPGGKGALWVALKIPDGYICAHANKARIGEFPLDDPENCLYDKRVISFAVEKGWYDPDSGRPFRFCDAYCPADKEKLKYTETRVWSIYRRCAPSLRLSPDYHRGKPGAKPYPLWIKPDKKLSLHDVMELMRDHYEGTKFDMTKGIAAGPFGCPYRWRPITWEADGKKGSWERPISDHRTGFSIVAQTRSWLPDPIGGVLWYGVDDAYSTVYIPLYSCITDVPPSYARGTLKKFSWDSAWWVFNFVANFANLRYSFMIKDIKKVQKALEGKLLVLQPAIERTALYLYKAKKTRLLKAFLTDYCVSKGEEAVRKWKELGEHLICKYNDGFVKDENGRPRAVGYPRSWLKKVLDDKED